MKKLFFAFLLCIGTMLPVLAQNAAADLLNNERDFLYITTQVGSKAEVNALARNFSVDNCPIDERTGLYNVRIYLSRHEYSDFLAQNLPFEIIPDTRADAPVATTLADMANWEKYPSYEVYVQMMQNFQTNFPNLCKIDTILAATPCTQRPHMLLAAHISNTLGQPADKPAFLYSATMHGDEVVGFHTMLRFIDYILNNPTDQQVQNLLQNVDLYICPLENPDGTYHSSNSRIGTSASQRANWNNVDMNRNYPYMPGVSGSANVQPETQAIINWVQDKHFVMSANFHGGAELTNFPWDSWNSQTRSHADDAWFRYVCQNYVDACQAEDPTYMVGETAYNPGCGSVTEGGDWYVITGSRQDYMNYYQHCREVTMEIHFDKVVTDASDLVTYFPNSKNALFNYAMECSYGFRGIVTDAVTGDPIDNAKIYVRNHDTFNSEVYSHLPLGTYYRPIKAGTYTVEVSADCYETQTFTVTTTDGSFVRHDVQLQPLVSTPQVADQEILIGETATLTATSTRTIKWYATATSTTPIATGNTFTTPALTQTTTYYVEEQATDDNNNTCVSDRSSATVFVLEMPRDTVYGELAVENCDIVIYEGETYEQSGDYEIFYPAPAGTYTDSILTLHVTVHPSYHPTLYETVHVGDTYSVEGTEYHATFEGTYTYSRLHYTEYGCDSLVQYVFYVLGENSAFGELSLEECSPFVYENEVLLMDGDYTFYYPGAGVGGIDSILVIHLTLHPSYEMTLEVLLSVGEHYMMGDYDFYSDEDGFFHFDMPLETTFGCDSIMHYNIKVGNGGSGTGVAETSLSSVMLYPNPVTVECHLTGLTAGVRTEIHIYNAFGQMVKELSTENESVVIDLQELKAGVYSVKLVQNGTSVIKKFIKL